MTVAISPTKGNLLNTKKSLELARLGYDLMDRKRNVLIREMMALMDDVRLLRDKITSTYSEAYYALQEANISLGVISRIASTTPVEDSITIVYRSIMGVEIPRISYEEKQIKPEYSFEESNSRLDNAYILFSEAKNMTIKLAEIDNSVYRLAKAVQKTQKRANALKNIVIPNFEDQISFISNALEEKEREEFTRMKVIKKNKQAKLV